MINYLFVIFKNVQVHIFHLEKKGTPLQQSLLVMICRKSSMKVKVNRPITRIYITRCSLLATIFSRGTPHLPFFSIIPLLRLIGLLVYLIGFTPSMLCEEKYKITCIYVLRPPTHHGNLPKKIPAPEG
jgi:hypothetical protein